MFLRSSLCTVSFLALASAAQAAPATQEGAARLTASFQTYLGSTPGVVTVTPQGETYAVQLDAKPLAALLHADQGKVETSPLIYTLTDNGDGTWHVTEDQPLNIKIDVPGKMSVAYTADRMVSDGIWDERLPGFAKQTATITNFGSTTVEFGPDGKSLSTSTQTTKEMQIDTTGTAGATGGADVAVDYTANGVVQTMTLPSDPAAPPMTVEMTASGYVGSMKIGGLKSRDLLALAGWFVAHPSQEAIKTGQDELRGIATAALPVFGTLTGTMTANEVSVSTPAGPFGAASLDVTFDANGVVSAGRFREGIAVKGLTVPAGLVPDWAANLVPGEVGLDFTASGFDLDAPARMLLKSMDLTKPEAISPEVEAQLGALALPDGKIDITLSPGRAISPDYTLTYEGKMVAGPGVAPTGTARITAQGLDKVQEDLAKAPPEVSGQVAMPLAMAMGMAKNENGTLIWDIDASTPGSLKVNGLDMMGAAPQ